MIYGYQVPDHPHSPIHRPVFDPSGLNYRRPPRGFDGSGTEVGRTQRERTWDERGKTKESKIVRKRPPVVRDSWSLVNGSPDTGRTGGEKYAYKRWSHEPKRYYAPTQRHRRTKRGTQTQGRGPGLTRTSNKKGNNVSCRSPPPPGSGPSDHPPSPVRTPTYFITTVIKN